MSRWLDKLRELFFGEVIEEGESTSDSRQNETTFAYREIEGKVKHVYPEPGQFRFPLPVESERAAKAINPSKSKETLKQPNPAKGEMGKQPFRSPTYFQGSLKQATDTPSPIYGFRKVEHKLEMNQRAPMEEDFVHTEVQPIEMQPIEEASVVDEIWTQMEEEQQDREKSLEAQQHVDKQRVGNLPEPDNQEESIRVSTSKVIPFRPHASNTQTNLAKFSSIPPSSFQPSSAQVSSYQTPALSTLQIASYEENEEEEEWTNEQAELLMDTFASFNLQAELIGVTKGPTVTRFEIQPAPGIKINKFTNLQDDLKLSLAAKEIRIEAPIPGKQAIGIEVPNLKAKPVLVGDILTSSAFQESSSPLTICLGADLSGQPVVTDIQKMPHGLIAGSTGSGKSVCINSILVSLLYKSTPKQLRLLLIDPKVVELSPYQRIPHLVTPVVTDPKQANAALKWAVEEMERRYQLFADEGVRDLERYNRSLAERTGEEFTLPYMVIIIDELADLMMVAPQDVEDSICRLTQKARACGIHLIVATQRPSVDVITGLIKANIPTRLAFFVSSQVDSRTILDMAGAERLLGRGDMLFLPNGAGKAFRVQGSYVSDEEIEQVVRQVSETNPQHFLFSADELHTAIQELPLEDELLTEAALFVLEQGVASASSLQRKFRIGYNRAARMIEWMEEQGMVSEPLGSKPRQVIWSEDQFLEWLDSQHDNG